MTVRELTIAIWVAIAVAAAGFEALARVTNRFVAPAGVVARLALRPLFGRVAVSLAWMWLGWHVFAR